jgi:aromatic-L-amino-acid decarboxylase
MNELVLTQLDERSDALEFGISLLRETWNNLDAARPGQPDISSATRALVELPLPEQGAGVQAALSELDSVLDESLAQARPRFFGYIASSGLESAVLADALAASHDCNMAAETAAANLLEQQALRWVGELVGYPAAGGVFTSGGMVSTLTALTAARTRALPDSRRSGVGGVRATVYTSADAHSSVERAVELLGLGSDQLRDVPVDRARRMDAHALAEVLAHDVAHGCVPVAVVATAGTTLTGAVDPIADIAAVCREHGVWLHVDGAYGLPAASVADRRGLFAGLELADSASVDAHKWLFVPKACGVLMVREPAALRQSFAHEASYMVEEEGFQHPVDWTLEYSRPFRSAKLWTALRAHGASVLRSAIAANLALANKLYDDVVAHPAMEPMLGRPDLSTVPFRRLPSSGDVDAHNMRLARELQADGRVFVTSAIIDGRACLRPCVVNFRTTERDIHALVEIADEVGRRLEHEAS